MFKKLRLIVLVVMMICIPVLFISIVELKCQKTKDVLETVPTKVIYIKLYGSDGKMIQEWKSYRVNYIYNSNLIYFKCIDDNKVYKVYGTYIVKEE
jgi:hypothetical protein